MPATSASPADQGGASDGQSVWVAFLAAGDQGGVSRLSAHAVRVVAR